LNSTMKTISFWVVLILLTSALLYNLVQHTSVERAQTVTFSRFLQEVERGNVAEVTIAGADIKARLRGGETFKTVMPTDYPPLIDMLRDRQVVIHRR
jgi:cell division protease FtsH